jgi:hypothetical protein
MWLLPGGHPGKHLATENIRSQLVERGIQPGTARNAAMYQFSHVGRTQRAPGGSPTGRVILRAFANIANYLIHPR